MEIKFRLWCESYQGGTMWIMKGLAYSSKEKYYFHDINGDHYADAVCFLMGKDCEGNDIFEGDIIEYTRMRTMMDGWITYNVVVPNRNEFFEWGILLVNPSHKMKVIGNVYQNKELITENNTVKLNKDSNK